MKLLFDARWIRPNRPDGLTRYSQELIAALAHEKDVELTLLVSDKAQAKDILVKNVLVFPKPTSPLELLTAARLRRHRFDAIYSPHFVFGGLGRNTPLVLSVLDLIPFHYPDNKANLLWRAFYSSHFWLKLILAQSSAVVTISRAVMGEVSALIDKPVAVIYSAPATITKVKPQVPKKQLLYIGRYEEYKNTELLISAMNELPEYELLLAGSVADGRRAELLATAPQNVTFVGRISDDEYAEFLASSCALVSASLEEGFGLPIVEAMASGLPVICSDIGVFKEVGADAALFFSPTDIKAMCSQVRALEDTKLRGKLVQAGLKRAADFSWDHSARKLVEFIVGLKKTQASAKLK